MLKIHLKGRRANRTPLSYPEYRLLFQQQLTYTQRPEDADLLIYSCFMDIRDECKELSDFCALRPDIKLVILSEEPYWDSLWSEDFTVKNGELLIGESIHPYSFLNHYTTKIYNFEKIPYFITTDNDYFARYSFLFSRNSNFSTSELITSWSNAQIRVAFYAEFRDEEQYDAYFPLCEVRGLSRYRTLIAQGVPGAGTVRVGHGWDGPNWREYLPDWHLDKLATLDKKALMVSGIENTHQCNYIAEKLFDAYAVLAIPLYYASPLHAALRLVPSDAFLNLYDLPVEQAIAKISSFYPDSHFIDAYLEAQTRLAKLFSQPRDLAEERRRVVAQVVAELHACC